MQSPIWIVVFYRDGEQWTILRCDGELDAGRTIYHNTYYHRRCLKITVKAWK